MTRILEAANLVVIEKLQHLKGKFAVAFDIWNDFSWNAPNSFFFGMKYLPVDDMRAICQTLRGISANIFCVRMRICDVQKRLAVITHKKAKVKRFQRFHARHIETCKFKTPNDKGRFLY